MGYDYYARSHNRPRFNYRCWGVVTRNIPPRSVAVGVPARVIESIDDYYEKYKDRVDFIKNLSESEKEKYLMEKFGLGEIE